MIITFGNLFTTGIKRPLILEDKKQFTIRNQFQMQITHKIDDFLHTIFPELAGGGKDLIINTLEKYYNYFPGKLKGMP
jgi:hypothetical protein